MIRHFKTLIISFSVIFFALSAVSQSDESDMLHAILQLTSQRYGSDEALINGLAYTPPNLYADGDPFLQSASYTNASITISDKTFEVKSLKYDIADEKLVLLVTLNSGARFPILLNNEFIQHFEIFQGRFFPANLYFTDNEVKGFVDIVYDGSFIFVTKYEKEFVKMYTKVDPYGKYSETRISHFLIRDGKPKSVKNKRNLLKSFSSNQKEISRYMKLNNIKFRKANHQQLAQLLKYCDELSENK